MSKVKVPIDQLDFELMGTTRLLPSPKLVPLAELTEWAASNGYSVWLGRDDSLMRVDTVYHY